MTYKVNVSRVFAGAHFLRNYKGKCENLHGHNWKIKASFSKGDFLDENGMVEDFSDIKFYLDNVMDYLDHKCLNDICPFDKINPTAENIAGFILDELIKVETGGLKVLEVEVWESEGNSAVKTR
ncbi:MAG: 6-carboxytetrahydropterin synthase QueD [Elusimicrobiota bacterium]|jgi:6-pyruvoyltetrahydropterin/6-carboxytetrahydropterin synthase|nr:6-carboxytetrahydropterin synthase QueD [Elusimicrobiota bacterium]